MSPQKTGADGGFCFHGVPPGSYALIPYKAGFIPIDPFGSQTVPGEPAKPLHLSLAPAPTVTQVPDDTFRAEYTPQQRAGFEIENAAFSADGRYLALVLSNIVTGDPEQAWRYDLLTHQLLEVTATPTEENMKFVNGIAWVGDTLYIRADALDGALSRPYLAKTEGDTTSRIASPPPEVRWPDYNLPREVGPYTVDGTPVTGAVTKLFMSPSGAPIAEVFGDWWVTLDDPPTLFFATESINVFYLSTRHMQRFRVSRSYDLEVLAVLRIPSGFRVAYKVEGPCAEPSGGIDPLLLPHNFKLVDQGRPRNLCLVDIPEEKAPNHPRPPAKK